MSLLETAKIYRRQPTADYPHGHIAIVRPDVLPENEDPVRRIVEFSHGELCTALFETFGIVAVEDYEVPLAACKKNGVPQLESETSNAYVHKHERAAGVLAHGSPVSSFLATDTAAVQRAYSTTFGAEDRVLPLYVNGNNPSKSYCKLVQKQVRLACKHFERGEFMDGAWLLMDLDDGLSNQMPVLEGIRNLQHMLRDHLQPIPLNEFPTVLIGSGALHGRSTHDFLQRKHSDVVHSLYPLICPYRDTVSNNRSYLYPEFTPLLGEEAVAKLRLRL